MQETKKKALRDRITRSRKGPDHSQEGDADDDDDTADADDLTEEAVLEGAEETASQSNPDQETLESNEDRAPAPAEPPSPQRRQNFLLPNQVRKLQRLLKLPADGLLGPQTLSRALDHYRDAPEGLSDEDIWLLQTAAFQADTTHSLEYRVPPVWIFYSNPPQVARSWIDDLQAGSTIFWIHGTYPRGGAYKLRLRAGDTVLLVVGDEFVADGVLLADERLHFYDGQRRVRRPVRVLTRYKVPVSRDSYKSPFRREALEAELGAPVVRQGAVHPVPLAALHWLNERLGQLTWGQLPYPEDMLASVLAAQSLAADLADADSYGILPDEETAKAIGWTGEIWTPNPTPQPKALTPYPGIEEQTEPPDEDDEAEGSQTPADDVRDADIDVQIPFVLDAPADSEDDLDRGPFALFLARRLHLIWCQVNGHAPDNKGGRLPAARSDAETFIVHVDSPWGGGKSTFANFVARVLDPRDERLTPRHFLRSSLAPTVTDGQVGNEPLDEVFVPPFAHSEKGDPWKWPGARRPWIVARYNAWRDQYVQPPWWQIFVTLQAAVTAEVRRDAFHDFVHKGDGPGFRGLARWIGAHFARFWYQVWNTKLQVQLGLLVLVVILFGIVWAWDVDAADGWIKSAAAILGVGGASIATLFTVLSQSLAPDLDFTSEHKQIGVRDPISRFRRAFARILSATDRPVLLIVDDLDRCEPRTVVEIMRGFQTIIRSPRLFVLLLGDRAWIEAAHDVYHKDLLAMGDGEAKLGSLYVRKVIQLSFRLPVMKEESRRRFAKRVLGDSDEAVVEKIVPVLQTVEKDSRAAAEQNVSIARKEEAKARIIEAAKLKLSTLSHAEQDAAAAAVSDIIDTQFIAAAGADTAQQREVFNAITQLVDCLPNNPRQIKRIFMAFATYERVGLRLFGYQLTRAGEHGELRARRWRQLAMWVTLAIEWPETWRAIARWPTLLDVAYGPKRARGAAELNLLERVAESDQPLVRAALRRLRSDPSLVALLSSDKANLPAEASEFARIAMEPAAVYEFNRIIWEPGFLLQPDIAAKPLTPATGRSPKPY